MTPSPMFSEQPAPPGASWHSRSDTMGIMQTGHQCVPCPPVPPNHVALRRAGEVRARREGAIAFTNASTRRHFVFSVDWPCRHHHFPRGTKASARFTVFQIPRIACFLPRIGSFFPRPDFSGLLFAPLYLSLFLEEKRRRKGKKGCKPVSTVTFVTHSWNQLIFVEEKLSPWVFVDGETQYPCGFTAVLVCIHGSTGGNACMPGLICFWRMG